MAASAERMSVRREPPLKQAGNGDAGTGPAESWFAEGVRDVPFCIERAAEKRNRNAEEKIWKLLVDEVWSIGLVGQSPAYMGTRVVNERLENVPGRTCVSQHCRTPWSGHPEQWFYK